MTIIICDSVSSAEQSTTYWPGRYHPRQQRFGSSHPIKHEGFELGPYFDPFKEFPAAYGNDDWDGCGAVAVSGEVLESARSFYRHITHFLRTALPRPLIAPGADGSIGFQWQLQSGEYTKIFVELRPGNAIRSYCVRRADRILEKQPAEPMQPDGLYRLDDVFKRIADGDA
jgi:hypothetical protein